MNDGAQQQTDVIVVGGGMAGLAAAAYVGRAGNSVSLLERSSHVGGRAITNEMEGFRFNLGPHALYKKGPGAGVLAELGVPYTAKTPLVRALLLRNEALHRVSLNPWHFMTAAILSRSSKLWIGPALVSILRTKPASVRDVTVQAWLAGITPREDLRELLLAFVRVTSYCNDPTRMSAEIAVTQLKLAAGGVLYLDDGWQVLVEGLRRAADFAGARLITNAKVTAIEHDDAGALVRLDDGTARHASAVIIATDPKTAATLVDDAGLRGRAERAVPVRAACLDLGLSRLPRPRDAFSLGIDRPYYFSVHSQTARLAPEGAAMIHVAKYLPSADDADAETIERELEEFVDLVQPGWRELTIQRRFLPNLEVVSMLPSAGEGGLAGRPGAEVSGIANVYLAGDWVGGEGWLSDASLASGKRAAELAVQATARRGRAAASSAVAVEGR